MTVIFYDGACGFCASCVRFVWKRDCEGIFHYAAIQSPQGGELLREHGIEEPSLNTMYLLEGGKLFTRSDAGLRIAGNLRGFRLLSRLGLLVPRILRDWVYGLVARNRQRLSSGRSCELPPPEVQARFLDRTE